MSAKLRSIDPHIAAKLVSPSAIALRKTDLSNVRGALATAEKSFLGLIPTSLSEVPLRHEKARPHHDPDYNAGFRRRQIFAGARKAISGTPLAIGPAARAESLGKLGPRRIRRVEGELETAEDRPFLTLPAIRVPVVFEHGELSSKGPRPSVQSEPALNVTCPEKLKNAIK